MKVSDIIIGLIGAALITILAFTWGLSAVEIGIACLVLWVILVMSTIGWWKFCSHWDNRYLEPCSSGDKYRIVKGGQIQAVREIYDPDDELDIGHVKIGAFGGYVDGPHNLSQDGRCWLHATSQIRDNARVSEDAYIGCRAIVRGDAVVRGKTGGLAFVIEGDAIVDGPHIDGRTIISGNAKVTGRLVIGDHPKDLVNYVFPEYGDGGNEISGNALICDHWVKIYLPDGNVWRHAYIRKGSSVSDHATILLHGYILACAISGHVLVFDCKFEGFRLKDYEILMDQSRDE